MNSRTLGIVLAAIVVALHSLSSFAQEVDFKQRAQEAFKTENYSQAISLLKQAIAQKPDDAEAYYYLGYFTHYLCYDSLPLTGYGEGNSDEVLLFLQKAVSLDPKLGNAYYFIGAEHGARFLRHMQAANLKRMIQELQKSREGGGFPDWLVEYNRNMLKSCEPNAVLFTRGDAETGSAWYLQYVENFRRDVTVIPTGALKWPWYVLTLKERADLVTALAPISWSKEQILAMHPYKWKANKVVVPISESIRKNYGLPGDVHQMEWLVEPDLSDAGRTYLSHHLAAMVDIIQTNAWKRPIHFSSGMSQKGLQEHLQLCGITYRLFPVKVGKDIPSVNEKKTRDVLLDQTNFLHVKDVLTKDYSRSSTLLTSYRFAYKLLLDQRAMNVEDRAKLVDMKVIFDTMKKTLPENIVPMPSTFSQWMEGLEKKLGEIK